MKNEIKKQPCLPVPPHCLPRAIFDFVLFSSQCPKSSTMRGLLALCWKYRAPVGACVAANKKKRKKPRLSTFWPLCRSDLQNNTEINGIKFKRGCFDKIDWNTWTPDWDVNENKRLEIVSADSFSGVFLFYFFLFFLSFFKLDSKFWISGVNDGKRPFFVLILLTWQLSQTKRRHAC